MIERWGDMEAVFFTESSRYLYGYVGLDDLRMHPLLRPGSLVLVDPKLRQIQNSGWTNEYERPVYFIELHRECRCCWCRSENGKVMLVPHPLSSCAPEVYRCPEEAEVIGQVVGVAMRLGPS
jgi:hypothetical protein